MREDKQQICDLFLKALQATDYFSDLVLLTYTKHKDDYSETVFARFAGGGERVANVTADSGIAMIRDILRQIM